MGLGNVKNKPAFYRVSIWFCNPESSGIPLTAEMLKTRVVSFIQKPLQLCYILLYLVSKVNI